jgi:hypothetical protein
MSGRPKLLVLLTYGFSVRYLLSTGLLDYLAQSSELAIGLGFQDDELKDLLTKKGFEVVVLPEAVLTHEYRSHRRQMALVHQKRMASPTTAIEKRARVDQTLGIRTRVLGQMRRFRDYMSVTRPGGAAAIEAIDAACVQAGSNLDEFRECLELVEPDAVLCLTPYHDQDALTLFAARDLSIASITSLISWDNPTTRARLITRSDLFAVWNSANAQELLRSYPELNSQQFVVTGAPQFDLHHRPELIEDESAWRERHGIPPDRPVILYGAGPRHLVPFEWRLPLLIDQWINSSLLPMNPFLIVRRHPADPAGPWNDLRKALTNGVVAEPWGTGSGTHQSWPNEDQVKDQMSTLAHCVVQINVSSSMTLDGAVFDRPQIGPRFVPGLSSRDAKQVRGLYDREHWLPVTASGGLATADDEQQLRDEIVTALTDPSQRSEGRSNLVESLLTFNDGHASERVAQAIERFLESNKLQSGRTTSETQSGIEAQL